MHVKCDLVSNRTGLYCISLSHSDMAAAVRIHGALNAPMCPQGAAGRPNEQKPTNRFKFRTTPSKEVANMVSWKSSKCWVPLGAMVFEQEKYS